MSRFADNSAGIKAPKMYVYDSPTSEIEALVKDGKEIQIDKETYIIKEIPYDAILENATYEIMHNYGKRFRESNISLDVYEYPVLGRERYGDYNLQDECMFGIYDENKAEIIIEPNNLPYVKGVLEQWIFDNNNPNITINGNRISIDKDWQIRNILNDQDTVRFNFRKRIYTQADNCDLFRYVLTDNSIEKNIAAGYGVFMAPTGTDDKQNPKWEREIIPKPRVDILENQSRDMSVNADFDQERTNIDACSSFGRACDNIAYVYNVSQHTNKVDALDNEYAKITLNMWANQCFQNFAHVFLFLTSRTFREVTFVFYSWKNKF